MLHRLKANRDVSFLPFSSSAWVKGLERVNFPESLEKLIFGSDFNQSLTVAKLPENLQLLAVSDAFDQCFGDALPVNLKELEFRFRSIWNHPLDDMTLPRSLETLTFASKFNQSLSQVSQLTNLKRLVLAESFTYRLADFELPNSLESLTVGSTVNLRDAKLPPSLRQFSFDWEFDESIDDVEFPDSIEDLHLGRVFDQSLDRVLWPRRLQTLSFGTHFNQPISKAKFPDTLKSISFGMMFNQSLDQVALPSRLESLSFGWAFNHSLDQVILPETLTSLVMGDGFNHSLERVKFPDGLQHLAFGRAFNQNLNQIILPNLTTLIFNDHDWNERFQDLEHANLPRSLTTLSCQGVVISSKNEAHRMEES